MDGSTSKGVFNMPPAPRSPCEDGVSLSMKPPLSRVGPRKKLKSRAKSRGKPTSQGAPSSSKDPINASAIAMDVDLNDICARLDGIEQSVTQFLESLQKEVTEAANFMLDRIMAGIIQPVDGVRGKIPEIQKLRNSNRAATSSLRTLEGLERA